MKKIRAFNEWSWVFCQHMPIAYAIQQAGFRLSVDCLTSASPFFYFANEIQEHPIRPTIVLPQGPTEIYEYHGNKFDPTEYFGAWTPPPLRDHYKNTLPKSDKPIIVINNKYNREWLDVPYNYLSIDFLERFFDMFESKYQIYYIRYQGDKFDEKIGYWDDHGAYGKFDDYELVSKYKSIITIYDVIEEHGYSYNEAQLYMSADAKHVVSVNGGNAVLSAYFGEDVMIYGHPNCKSTVRHIWGSKSWLKRLSGANILGHLSYETLLKQCEDRWL